MILPKQVATWGELIDDILPKALNKANNTRITSSYNFRNVYFWDNVDAENAAGKRTLPHSVDSLSFTFTIVNGTNGCVLSIRSVKTYFEILQTLNVSQVD